MRFVILGAGAVGGTIGGLLADAGHEVLLLARGLHARAINDRGLRLATPSRVLQLWLPVVERPEDLVLRNDDVLLLTVKSHQTSALLEALPRQDLPVVCAQNGVANERMALRRCAHVYGMVVMLPAVHLEPGDVDAQGTPYSGLLDVGCYPTGVDDTAAEVASALSASGFVSQPTPDIMRWKHAKLLRNLNNALEALCGHDHDDDGREAARQLSRRARAEAEACYAAAGIAWASDDEWNDRRKEQVQWAPVEGRGRTGGSTWQSLARGSAELEGDYLNGEIVLLGRLHGVQTPVNAALQQHARLAAREHRAPGAMRAQDLLATVDTMGA
ncbi:MAG TPA: 2-dehydropantoate 2-reductase N-terminal domain-containing protein [Mycobacteriales bacterium]|nr:2-dehydropantoate 2-reductase N-terminal domain-containing protein [Mycobacteriales bacterium]